MAKKGYSLKRLKELVNSSPVYRFLGMEVVHASQGSSRLELIAQDDLKNLYGIVHGGILATLLDSACGVALGTLLGPDESALTLDLRINYFSPFHTGPLIAEGKVIHKGRNTGVAEATLKTVNGHRIAKGMTTHFIRKVPLQVSDLDGNEQDDHF